MKFTQPFGAVIVLNSQNLDITAYSKNCALIFPQKNVKIGCNATEFLPKKLTQLFKKIPKDYIERYCYQLLEKDSAKQEFLVNFFKVKQSIFLEIVLNNNLNNKPYLSDLYNCSRLINTSTSKNSVYNTALKIFKQISNYDSILVLENENNNTASLYKKITNNELYNLETLNNVSIGKLDNRSTQAIINRPIRYAPDLTARSSILKFTSNETLKLLENSIAIKLATKQIQYYENLGAKAVSVFYSLNETGIECVFICLNKTPKEILISKRKDLMIVCEHVSTKLMKLKHEKEALKQKMLQKFIIQLASTLKNVSSPKSLIKITAKSIATKIKSTSYLLHYYDHHQNDSKLDISNQDARSILKNSSCVIQKIKKSQYLFISLSDDSKCFLCYLLNEERNLSTTNLILLAKQVRLFVIERLASLYHYNQSTKDPLTKLYNRYFLEQSYKKESLHCIRNNVPLSIAILDIDKFKLVNDKYGHDAGDQVLIFLANFLNRFFRSSDTVCRYGGEEFIILMPDSSLEASITKCEKALAKFRKKEIQISKSTTIKITFSAGVSASNNKKPIDLDAFIKEADQALYAAKESGRNRVLGPK